MESFHLLTVIGAVLSVILSLGLIFVLKNKKSNYSRIMRHVLMSESIFIFSEMMIVSGEIEDGFYVQLRNIFNTLVFNIKELSFSDSDDFKDNVLKIANMSCYYSIQSFSILLNIFICLEIILILKNPISQLKSRLKSYFLFSAFIGILVFFLSFFLIVDNDYIYYEKNSAKNIYISNAPIYFNFIIYLIFICIGSISLIYLFVRFCFGKPLLHNLKNFFVIRHFIYIILYALCLLPNKTNEFIKIIGSDDYIFLQEGILINIFMGSLMFLIRVSETNFYNILFCSRKKVSGKRKSSGLNDFSSRNMSGVDNAVDTSIHSERDEENQAFFDRDQPLTAIISRNMNLEFMCCILYGLSEIFLKPERKNRGHGESTIDRGELTVTMFPNQYSDKSLLYNNNKNISVKDYHRAKPHKIRYKKIFDSDIDFDKLEVEVTAMKKKKSKEFTMDASSRESETQLLDNDRNQTDHDAVIIEYCPRVFRELRKLDDISGFDLSKALDPSSNKESMNKVRESEGKSGSFFFFSHDNKFIIKTITNNELNTMLGNFMQNYYEHTSTYSESLLARIYGLYSIVIKGVSKINIILMQNLITMNKYHIKRIFDLKGSRVERITKNIEKCDKMKTLKDLDYLWMIKIEEDMVDFTRDQCEELISVLENDLRMLRDVGVMDYSLLLIIIHFPKANDPDYEKIINLFGDKRYCSRIFKSKNMKYMYLLGIIDYLQKFNVAKFFENKYKSILYGNEIKYVSAVDPMIYAERMFNFARDYLFITHS